jgi:hypothetical protein
MKKGDVVYCIKDVTNTYRNGYVISHKYGQSYKCTRDICSDSYGSYIYISSENNTTTNEYLGFCVSSNYDGTYDWHSFSEHFVTQTQYRLLKLKKLNEKR